MTLYNYKKFLTTLKFLIVRMKFGTSIGLETLGEFIMWRGVGVSGGRRNVLKSKIILSRSTQCSYIRHLQL